MATTQTALPDTLIHLEVKVGTTLRERPSVLEDPVVDLETHARALDERLFAGGASHLVRVMRPWQQPISGAVGRGDHVDRAHAGNSLRAHRSSDSRPCRPG